MEIIPDNTRALKYTAYKDSGVKWLGDIPESWGLTKLGTIFLERKIKVSDKDYEPLSVTKNGTIPQLENAAKSNDGDNRKLVKKGDFVINSRSDRKGSSGIAYQDGSVSLICIVLEPKNIDPIYCNYLLKSYNFVEEFYRMGHGIVADLWTTRYDEMKTIMVGIPSFSEQSAIANFLDLKTNLIDKAINIKEKQIELLIERRNLLILKAVTRGLNPNVIFKNSGVDWIGKIPKHWNTSKLGAIFELKSDKNHPEFEILSVYREYGVIKKDSRDDNINVTSEDTSNYKAVEPGDLVVNKMKAWQGSMGISEYKGIVSPAYITCKMKSSAFNNKYLHYLLRSHLYIGEYNRLSYGVRIGQWDMHYEDFKKVPILIPPKNEQSDIVDFIEIMKSKIETTIHYKINEIDKLKEYKNTLINSAVTGKIKVC